MKNSTENLPDSPETDTGTKIDEDLGKDDSTRNLEIDTTTVLDPNIGSRASGSGARRVVARFDAELEESTGNDSGDGHTMGLFSGILSTRALGKIHAQSRPAEEEKQEFLRQVDAHGDGLVPVDTEYDVAEEIARGGQGYVRRAVDRFLGRTVAVKTLDDRLNDKEEYRQAFVSEAQVMAQLDHPAIVPVYGIHGDKTGGMHMAMKLVQGKTLKQYLAKANSLYKLMSRAQVRRSERRMLSQRLDIFLNVCAAISYVHYRNVIHRDLKPENIMIGKFNETYVMDWGIAEYRSKERGVTSATRGKLHGTPQYIAPEVINRKKYDSRSDIYSLGLILFELVYLKPAYNVTGLQDALKKARLAQVGSYTHAYGVRIDRDLEMIVRKALSADVNQRYQNVKTLAGDLRNYREMEEVSANPDGVFSRLWRRLRQHNRALLFVMALMFFGVLASASFALYRHAQTQLLLQEQSERQMIVMRNREAALTDAYTKGITEGEHFNSFVAKLENLVQALSNDGVLMLQSDAVGSDKGYACEYNAGDSPKTAPAGYGYSPTYRQKISFDAFSYKTPPDEKIENLDALLKKLQPLRTSFFRTLMSSETADAYRVQDRKAVEQSFRIDRRPSLGWAYLALTNGLHMSYPFHSDYKEGYDPRKRKWYLDAKQAKYGQPVWSMPYIDNGDTGEVVITCSRALIGDDGKLLGVAGSDVFTGRMREIMEKDGNVGPHVKNKMLVDTRGRIILDLDRDALADIDGDGVIDFRLFGEKKLLEEMRKVRNGRCFNTENGVKYLYFFMEIKSLDWLYIVKIDYDKMLAARK